MRKLFLYLFLVTFLSLNFSYSIAKTADENSTKKNIQSEKNKGSNESKKQSTSKSQTSVSRSATDKSKKNVKSPKIPEKFVQLFYQDRRIKLNQRVLGFLLELH